MTTAGDVHVPLSTSTASGADSVVKTVTLGTASSQSLNTSAQAILPQSIMAPFQIPGGSGQTQLQTQLALSQMLAPMQGVQPSVMLELNASATKDGIGELLTWLSFSCVAIFDSLSLRHSELHSSEGNLRKCRK